MGEAILAKLEKDGYYPIESTKFKNVIYFFDPKKRCINIITKNTGKLAIDILGVSRFIGELLEVTDTYKEDINYA